MRNLFAMFFFAPVILVTSCNSNARTANGSVNVVDSSVSRKNDEIAAAPEVDTLQKCIDVVRQIVLESDFKSPISGKLNIWIDDVNDNIITIKITYDNEENRDVALSWLELDIERKELRDVTIDPENPKKMRLSEALLDSAITKCLKDGQRLN